MSTSDSDSVEEDGTDSSDFETDASLSLENDSCLEDLYESFEFEDDMASSQASLTPPTDVLDQQNHIADTSGGSSGRTLVAGLSEAPLYPGAQLSEYQSHLLVFQYAIRHSLTTKAFTELLKLLSVHVPQGSAIPKSVYSLKRSFVDAFPEAKASQHFYCSCCQRAMRSAGACSGSGCSNGHPAVFITIPLGPQIKRMMEGMHQCC